MKNSPWEKIKSVQTVLAILMTLGYLLTTHLSTINSLEMALSGKADKAEIVMLDKKLTRIEIKLEEAILTRAELRRLREVIDRQSLRSNQPSVQERIADDGNQ